MIRIRDNSIFREIKSTEFFLSNIPNDSNIRSKLDLKLKFHRPFNYFV